MPVSVNSVGSTASGAGNITVNYPTRQNNDILILFVESNAGEPVTTVTAGAGGGTWTNMINTSTTASSLGIWWSRWTTGQASSLTVTDTGDHQIGGIISFSNCVTTGNPFQGALKGPELFSTTTNTAEIPSVNTTYYNTLIVGSVTNGRDNNFSAEFSNYTNANLTNITERIDDGTVQGAGGGFGVFTANFNNVGATGITLVSIVTATEPATGAFALIATDSLLPHTGWGIPIN
jgi:hypothetical protein